MLFLLPSYKLLFSLLLPFFFLLGSVKFIVRLNLKKLFQPKWFYDSISLLSRLWNYTYTKGEQQLISLFKKTEWVKRPCLPNGRVYFSFEKDITNCGKGSGYSNDLFVCLFLVVSSWKMKTNGKNLHNTLESMTDLNHL